MTTIEETLDNWVYNNEILVFKPEFNKPLDEYYDILIQYDKVIFSIYYNNKMWNE